MSDDRTYVARMTDLRNRFDYHRPDAEKVKAHEAVRGACFHLALQFFDDLPEGREKASAITKIEEAMFWANAAIARNQLDDRTPA